MEDLDLDIPEFIDPDNFSIIYKGKKDNDEGGKEEIIEIKTSKEEFLRKLRYFKDKTTEINQTSDIFIHDIYPIKIFKEFIETLKTKKIRINESNYSYYLKMSIKYKYYELKQLIESFLEKRPDIINLIENLQIDEIDYDKEEIISKHLDICLQNQIMSTFPIPILIRILNSPKRILNNHHLLFSFVKKIIANYESSNTNEDNETKNQNIQLLLSSFNYLQMSSDELDELFNSKHFTNIFNNKGTIEIMKSFVDERKNMSKKIDELEKMIGNQQQKHSNEINEIMKKQNEMFGNQEKKHSNEIEKIMKMQNEMFENLEHKHSNEINEIMKKQNEMFDKINEINQKFEEQSRILINYKTDNKLLHQKITELEKEKMTKKGLKGSININVLLDQKIEGEIIIKEREAKLDKTKSKYLLNNQSSSLLGLNGYEGASSINSLNQKFSFVKTQGTYYLHALLVDSFGNSKEIVSSPITTKGATVAFEYTGKVQSVTLEPGSYKLEVWGAEGGQNRNYSYMNKSGKGGYSVGIIKLKEKTPLFVYVGESPSSKIGGWNGGGSGSSHKDYGSSAGGGGATDISLYGTEGSSEWNTSNHLFSRIIVAGAGGGSGRNDYSQGFAGYGGGLKGGDSEWGPIDNGGSQTKAGQKNRYSSGQGFGVGGTYIGQCSSGGGGGWFGGAASDNGGEYTGGAGGSGYVYNESTASYYPNGCLLNSSFYLDDSSTKEGNSLFPSPSGSSCELGHNGNGFAKITPF